MSDSAADNDVANNQRARVLAVAKRIEKFVPTIPPRHWEFLEDFVREVYESRGVVGFAPAFPGVAQPGCSS